MPEPATKSLTVLETRTSPTADVAVLEFTLTRVQSCAHLYPQARGVGDDGAGASYGARRTVEDCERTISDHVNLAPSEPLCLFVYVRTQTMDKFLPAFFSESFGVLLRVNDSREEHCGEHSIRLKRVAHARHNSSTSSRIASWSPTKGRWSWPGNSTYFAPGILSAT